MEKNNYLILDDEFIKYCRLNNIIDVEKKAMEIFKKGFDIEKYGSIPQLNNSEDLKKPTKIIEGKEIGNNKIVTTPKSNVMPALQKPLKKDTLYD